MEINKGNVYISCFFWIQNYSAGCFCTKEFFGIIFSKNERTNILTLWYFDDIISIVMIVFIVPFCNFKTIYTQIIRNLAIIACKST